MKLKISNKYSNPNRTRIPTSILVAHQPEFLPWLGNLSKAAMGDNYYILDSVQYVKGVFQNRNKIRIKGAPGWQWLIIPIKNNNKLKMWKDVEIDNTKKWKKKHLNAIKLSYGKAKHFKEIFPEIEGIYNNFKGNKLIDFNELFIRYAFKKFNINVPIKRTSNLINQEYITNKTKSDLILGMCKCAEASVFVFGKMGRTYIDNNKFCHSVENLFSHFDKPLAIFQNFEHPKYKQIQGGDFIPNMCFLDLLFNEGENSKNILTKSKYDYE